MSLQVILNGNWRAFDALDEGATILGLVSALDLQPDRIAIEHNGAIAPRKTWQETAVGHGDTIELVHFVGGGDQS